MLFGIIFGTLSFPAALFWLRRLDAQLAPYTFNLSYMVCTSVFRLSPAARLVRRMSDDNRNYRPCVPCITTRRARAGARASVVVVRSSGKSLYE